MPWGVEWLRGGGDARNLSVGFLNCRGWSSREVDVKCLLKGKSLDVLSLAETFLLQEGEVGQACKWRGRAAGGEEHQV